MIIITWNNHLSHASLMHSYNKYIFLHNQILPVPFTVNVILQWSTRYENNNMRVLKHKDTQKKMYMMYDVQLLQMFPETNVFSFSQTWMWQAEVWVGLLFVLHIYCLSNKVSVQWLLAPDPDLYQTYMWSLPLPPSPLSKLLSHKPPLTLGAAIYLLNSWASSYFPPVHTEIPKHRKHTNTHAAADAKLIARTKAGFYSVFYNPYQRAKTTESRVEQRSHCPCQLAHYGEERPCQDFGY